MRERFREVTKILADRTKAEEEAGKGAAPAPGADVVEEEPLASIGDRMRGLREIAKDATKHGEVNKLERLDVLDKLLVSRDVVPKIDDGRMLFGSLTSEENGIMNTIGWSRAPDVTYEDEQNDPVTAWEKNIRYWRSLAAPEGLARAETKPVRAAREIMTPRALQSQDQIKAAIEKHIRDMVGDKVKIDLVDATDFGPVLPGWGTAGFNEGKVTSASYTPRRETREGVKVPIEGVIKIALQHPTRDNAVNHEAVHALIDLAATDPEVEVLKRERPRNRQIVKAHMDLTDQEVNNISGPEIDAVAGEIYMADRDNGGTGNKFGFHAALRALFDRLWKLLRQIRNALHGLGFHTSEDIYGRMHRGEMADRPMRETPGIDRSREIEQASQRRGGEAEEHKQPTGPQRVARRDTAISGRQHCQCLRRRPDGEHPSIDGEGIYGKLGGREVHRGYPGSEHPSEEARGRRPRSPDGRTA